MLVMLLNLKINQYIIDMNKTLVVFFEGHFYGGAEKMLLWLATSLKKEGYNVRICQIYDNVDLSSQNIQIDNLHLKFVPSYLVHNIRYFTCGAIKIIHYLHKNNVKYVLSFGSNSFYLLGVLKHLMKFKLLVSERGFPPAKRFYKLRKILFEKSDICVFQTSGAKQYFNVELGEKAFIIPNPVEIPELKWQDDGLSNVVIFVGRLDIGHKRVDLLINAFQKVLTSVPDAVLRIVGSGYDEVQVRKIVLERGLREKVEFIGFSKNVLKELSSARVFVLCSDIEGMPNALLEAMAFGMPVVSTDCSPGGAAFLLGNNENGILVPKGDANELAKAVAMLLMDAEKRNYYAQKAREQAANHNPRMIISEWKKAIDKFMG